MMTTPVEDQPAVVGEAESPPGTTAPRPVPLAAPLPGELITWHDGLSVGHAGLDGEHKALFRAVNSIYALRGDGADIAAVRRTADGLAELLATHFAEEEAMLARAGYPRLESHRSEHAALLRQLAQVRDRYARRPEWAHGNGFVWSLIDFLLEVTIGHIFKADLDYRDYLRGH